MKRTTLGSTFGVIFILSIFIIGIGHSQGDYDICPECYNSDMAVRFYFIGLLIIGMGIHSKKEYLETEEIIFDIESEPILHTDEATEGLQFAGEGIVESGDGQLQSPYTHSLRILSQYNRKSR